ncbi:hypothetical protein FHS85_000456 [Rhodoligotrophos appendicifer]|uniref:hypothetical protein n=1 Tax=Rhodoligotrophos appendicifer TaxID=987056 RepID=UPI00117FD328|nr:hypothetical protein [Rhodoligotrophos appendicifer]
MSSFDNLARASEPVDETTATAAEMNALVARLRSLVERQGPLDLPEDALRELMWTLVEIHGAKFDAGQRIDCGRAPEAVSATAVLVTASAMLKASNLEIFELGMWQSWSGTR